jgi:hypothetical protein
MSLTSRWLITTIALVLALVAAERFIALPPAFFWRTEASADMCAVYRAWYRDRWAHEDMVLRAGTAPWRPMISLNPKREATEGIKELRFLPVGAQPASDSEFVVDVSAYSAPLLTPEPLFVRHCFEQDSWIVFSDAPTPMLNIRYLFNGGKDIHLWEASPVGFSSDGKRALIYATNICSGWCGGGVFFLFERRGRDWAMAATSVAWIS